MMNTRRLAVVLAIACGVAWNVRPTTQSRGAPPGKEAFHTLTLEQGIAPIGKVGGLYGRTDGTGHRIVAENLSVVQPITVVAVAADASRPLRVDLVKGGWDQPMRSGTTSEDGRVVFKTRTEGNLGILVRSAAGGPASYVVYVWAGDELPSEPTPIFTAARDTRASGSSSDAGGAIDTAAQSSTSHLWLGGGGLFAIALIGVFVMRRRSQSHRKVEP